MNARIDRSRASRAASVMPFHETIDHAECRRPPNGPYRTTTISPARAPSPIMLLRSALIAKASDSHRSPLLVHRHRSVIPTKTGISVAPPSIPAYAGMTTGLSCRLARLYTAMRFPVSTSESVLMPKYVTGAQHVTGTKRCTHTRHRNHANFASTLRHCPAPPLSARLLFASRRRSLRPTRSPVEVPPIDVTPLNVVLRLTLPATTFPAKDGPTPTACCSTRQRIHTHATSVENRTHTYPLRRPVQDRP